MKVGERASLNGWSRRKRARLTIHHILAAELQPESQKPLWRMQVTSHERDFFTGRSEGQKVEQTRMGVRAAAAESDSALRAEGAATIKSSVLLSFL